MIQQISVQELNQCLQDESAILIDVREAVEYNTVNIQQARLIPLAKICINNLPNHNNKKLVIHCKSGMRSMNACNKLLAENPDLQLFNLDGGILAWQEARLPTHNLEKKTLPLERQVQLTIGILLLISAVLINFVNPLFLLIPTFIGLGLTFAGLTGHCGLGLLIAKMPWNKKK